MSQAVYAALNVAELTELAPGGVSDVIPQNSLFPCVLYEVNEVAQHGGFGSKPGSGALPEVDLRVHVFSQYGGIFEAQRVMAKVLELLAVDNALSVSGYTVCGTVPFYDQTLSFPAEMVADVPVRELVSTWRLYVQEN